MTLRAIMAALMAVLVFITGPPDITPARVPDPRSVVLEDDPRWDCRTDGNRICRPGNAYPLGDHSRAGKGRLGTLGAEWPATRPGNDLPASRLPASNVGQLANPNRTDRNNR